MAHIYNAGYAVVDTDPNGIVALQSGHQIRLAAFEDGTKVWRFVEANTAGTKWVELPDGDVNTLYSADDSLDSARIVSMGTNQLTWSGAGGDIFMNSGRLGVQSQVFGGSRLGDSPLQTTAIDIQSINFKDAGQLTALAMFFSPVAASDGYVTTMKNFVDDVNVISVAGVGNATAFGGVSREVESTVGLRNDFSGGEFRVFDTFNNDYDSATPVAEAQGWVAIHGGGATAKKIGMYRYDTTTYSPVFEVDTANVTTFSQVVKGVDGVDPEDLVTKSQLDAAAGGSFVTTNTTQNISATKTFDNNSSLIVERFIIVGDTGTTDGNVGKLLLTKRFAFSGGVGDGTFTQLYADLNGNFTIRASGKNDTIFNAANITAQRTYDLPDADGEFLLGESGTFSPTLVDTAGTATITNNVASAFYRKNGDVVHFDVRLTSVNSDVALGANLRLNGLPYSGGIITTLLTAIVQDSSSNSRISDIATINGTSIFFRDSSYNTIGAAENFDGTGFVQVSGSYIVP